MCYVYEKISHTSHYDTAPYDLYNNVYLNFATKKMFENLSSFMQSNLVNCIVNFPSLFMPNCENKLKGKMTPTHRSLKQSQCDGLILTKANKNIQINFDFFFV